MRPTITIEEEDPVDLVLVVAVVASVGAKERLESADKLVAE
jgi:hypothetical protein